MKVLLRISLVVLLMISFSTIYAGDPKLEDKANEDEEGGSERELTPIEKQVKEILDEAAKSEGFVNVFVVQLIKIGEPAKKPLLRALYSENDRVVETAAMAISNICDSSIIPELVKALIRQINKHSNSHIFSAITKYKEKALPELIKNLNNDNEYVRYRIIMLIGEIGGAVEKQKELYKKEKSNIVKLQIIRNLYKTDEDNRKEYLEFVHKMLNDKDNFTKCIAIYIVGEIKDTTQIDFLIKCIDDESIDVRLSVISALCDIGTEKTVSAVIKILKHKDITTRYYAAEGLSLINSEDENLEKKIIKGLIEALNDKNKEVRSSVINALSAFDDLSIIPHLEKIAKNDPEEKLQKLAKDVIEIIKWNKQNTDKQKQFEDKHKKEEKSND